MVQRVGLVGVGTMGSAMSTHLIDRGYEVRGYDLSPALLDALRDRGGIPVASVEDLAAGSDALITSLPSVAAAEEVLSAIGSVLRPNLTVIETSTLPLSLKARHQQAFLGRGAQLLDCPLSGTGGQALTRDVVVFGSGDVAAFEAVTPVLEAFSRSVRYLGPFGKGTVMKFVANLLVSVHNAATAEAFALGLRAGLDPHQLYETIRDGAGNSVIFEKRGPSMVERRYLPAATKASMYIKDIECITSFADDLGLATPVLDSAMDLYRRAVTLGLGDQDAAVLLEVIGAEPETPRPGGAIPNESE